MLKHACKTHETSASQATKHGQMKQPSPPTPFTPSDTGPQNENFRTLAVFMFDLGWKEVLGSSQARRPAGPEPVGHAFRYKPQGEEEKGFGRRGCAGCRR